MAELSESTIADRVAEIHEFNELLQFDGTVRLLVISDGQGTGKSTLLRRMRWECTYKHGVPATLVDLNEATLNSEFQVANKVVEGLSGLVPFPRFERLNNARALRDWNVFSGGPVSGRVDLTGATVSGGTQIGSYFQTPAIHIGQASFAPASPAGHWTPEQQRLADQQGVAAFLDDLREAGQGQTIVILLDAFEALGDGRLPGLKDNVFTRLLVPLCCDGTRATKVLTVIAGRAIETYEGTRFDAYVRARTPSPLGRDDLQQMLRLKGIDLKPDRFELFHNLVLNERPSIERAIDLAKIIEGWNR